MGYATNTVNLFGSLSSSTIMQWIIITLLMIVMSSTCFPVGHKQEAVKFLKKYGYLEESHDYRRTEAVIPENVFTRALLKFQMYAGIPQTGKLDNPSLTMMRSLRCGDKDNSTTLVRRKRYLVEGSSWIKRRLTYRISKYPTGLNDHLKVDREIARALKVWSDVSPMKFEEKRKGRVNINIRFEEGEHGDGMPLDGKGGTLAHAYFPRHGGDVHFDDEEDWTISESPGTSLFYVAAHEFGHSLGVDHSTVQTAVMNAYYDNFEPASHLDKDDIDAIQSIYGSSEQPVTPSIGGDIDDISNLCEDPAINAITRIQNGNTFVFKGAHYWQIVSEGIANGYPRRISTDWGGLEGNLDAAVTWTNGKTFFFKDSRYWRLSNKDMDLGFPKDINIGFQGIPDNIDAAFLWSKSGKTYFFKGDQYWGYDSNANPPVSVDYPKPISNWKGLPNSIDAAFQGNNGRTYFFKGDKYYKLNDLTMEVDSGNPPYPRLTSVKWFNCTPISN